ncbi:hypothetical protein BKA67DRAFT_284423 [Truncatella angustata]|uniref:Homeobox domain-containing protein n=1 Tax=Truncatella angustata TaxID=152316 RepID=A0A9P8ZZ37_9PEZI|nr:uncharacterized protein BKA67DRAFT_284423 [Truncatella angustata]KAH6654620.1 hypothetical protein BKA67DRAFT_284423 [Truncatella angustata]KAH8194858.1 hypothetical protein TruAng_010970 [Truncatella angustata]
MGDNQPYVTIRTRRPTDGMSIGSSGDSTVRGRVNAQEGGRLLTSSHQYGSSAGDDRTPATTHDISRVNYHVKHISDFAKSLEDSAARAFPNRGLSQRYKKVQALLLHWTSDDLFVLPELEDLERCFREEYSWNTDTFPIPSDNSHLELMMKIGQMVKEHESTDTLFVIYYGGHARIDESRQSTWCGNRGSDSPWLQWSAIQTLLERSLSDVLILLDCCAGAASATFPNGNSITETISASSWDAIAPDPGRYSFTSAVIEVLQEWKHRTYSAAMLHAEILARLKHPRPIMHNGRNFEARSTPVHFMMTNNHKAPSIEMARILSEDRIPPSPPAEPENEPQAMTGRSGVPQDAVASEPNEDVPHVMISLALEENQALDVNAWESWLAAFPAIAKYVKVQGVFKSHSTLLLLSLPVMVWDLLPNDLACNFIGFIRSNNLAAQSKGEPSSHQLAIPTGAEEEAMSILSGTTATTFSGTFSSSATQARESRAPGPSIEGFSRRRTAPASEITTATSSESISNQMIMNQSKDSRRTISTSSRRARTRPDLAPHVQSRLELYFQDNPSPTVGITEFLASNLGVETTDINLWFLHRREQQQVDNKLRNLPIADQRPEPPREGARMILPGHLNNLLEIVSPDQILLVDMRAKVEYDRSHIHGSINFRAPASFVQRAPLEIIEKTLTDEASRETFNGWYTCKCIIFYDRHVEYAWESPTAEALIQKFRSKRWSGQGFILKGHYREFSDSFDKYIDGQRISGSAKKYLESLQEKSAQKKKENQEEYEDWLKLLEGEDRALPTELAPAVKTERAEAAENHQKDLEIELERRLPHLYRKVLELKPDDNWNIKAPIVEHLSRGLEKMHHTGRGGVGGSRQSGYADKLQQDRYRGDVRDVADSDDDSQGRDGANQKTGAKSPPEDSSGTGGADSKKGRGRNVLRNILRSGR